MQYNTSGNRTRFGMKAHHTDSLSEYSYDRDSHVGKLTIGPDDAIKYKRLIADMKNDRKKVYPSDK